MTREPLLFDLTGRAELRVSGKDRAAFLHGLLTNDIARLTPGAGVHAALLSPKGKMRADLVVLAREDAFFVDAEPLLQPALEPLLRGFLFFQEVVFEDLSTVRGVLHVTGDAPFLSLGMSPLPTTAHASVAANLAGHDVLLVREARTARFGIDVRASREALPTLKDALLAAGAREAPLETLEDLRIEAGIPRWGADLDENVLPNEAWFERDAISYNKGCYIGQETVARIRTYGHVNRHLVRLLVTPGEPPVRAGDELSLGGEKVGKVTSAAVVNGAEIALGYVKREHEETGTELLVAGRAATITDFPLPS